MGGNLSLFVAASEILNSFVNAGPWDVEAFKVLVYFYHFYL
jgi:hypothetical protein